ncbi:MAG: topoisomerase IV [Clostridia bacterium]|nr:topoisomerase IV [Clostridia bacterium]
MAKKKKESNQQNIQLDDKTHIFGAGEVVNQEIVDTIENNFMPYAMSIILSRAIPEIDGFKPSHRKILYMMYKMGLLNSARAKSAKIVGQVMQLNPHGDAAIYDTMVRLSKGYDALLHPYVDSKGNFGKAFSRDMKWAASRYTEAKLEKICSELFGDIDKDTVDMVDNFDNTMKEPALLPVTFPTVLVNSNSGIAAGMASEICSFNLTEVCNATIALLKHPKADITEILLAPDFSGGGILLYDKEAINSIYTTGKGRLKIRAKYTYDKSNSCIEITEIPYTTTSEAIIDKVIEKVKAGGFREINDIRDETDLSGLKITIDIKRGTDADSLMQSLYASTPLEDAFNANFNVLVKGKPRVMGVYELLDEWIKFRMECVRRRTSFELGKAKARLKLLKGLEKILLDIDKAISIIRQTEAEAEVVPNLMIGFGLDKDQAEYIAEIKLRHLNREYILKRLQDIETLTKGIADREKVLEEPKLIRQIIITELKEVIKKYGKPRRTEILYEYEESKSPDAPDIPDYAVTVFFTREGYFKKVTPQSLRMSTTHKLKEEDEIKQTVECKNSDDLLFFTNMQCVYKTSVSNFPDTKISLLGDFVPAKLGMEPDEYPLFAVPIEDYKGRLLYVYENGKAAKVELSAFETKTNRKKLIKASSSKSALAAVILLKSETDVIMISSDNKYLIFNTSRLEPTTNKSISGTPVMKLKKGRTLSGAKVFIPEEHSESVRYKPKTFPSTGEVYDYTPQGEQLTFTGGTE